MTTTYDRLLRYRVVRKLIPENLPYDTVEENCAMLIEEVLGNAIVIDSTEVAKKIEGYTRDEEVKINDAPLRPPFDVCFLEAKHIPISKHYHGDLFSSCCAAVITAEIDDRNKEYMLVNFENISGEPRWFVTIIPIIAHGTQKKYPGVLPYQYLLALDEEGYVLKYGEGGYIGKEEMISPQYDLDKIKSIDEKNQSILADMYKHASYIYRMTEATLMFLNCKNIVLKDNPPNPKLSKRSNKKYGMPLISYKTLEVKKPGVTTLSDENPQKRPLSHRSLPLHMVRGHIRTYSPERGGPFGRPISQPLSLFISPHTRGEMDKGMIVKDYKTIESNEE